MFMVICVNLTSGTMMIIIAIGNTSITGIIGSLTIMARIIGTEIMTVVTENEVRWGEGGEPLAYRG